MKNIISVNQYDLAGEIRPDILRKFLTPFNISNTLLYLCVCVAFLVCFQSLSAQVSFSVKTDFVTGNGPFAVSIGDLNMDGKSDLAVVNNNDNTVSILLNTTSHGVLDVTYSPKTDFTVGSSPRAVSIGDLNGDGKPDLVVTNIGDHTVSVLLNTTEAGSSAVSFSPKANFMTGNSPCSVSIGDLNDDGKSDLAVSNSNDSSVSILINTMEIGATVPSFSSRNDFLVDKSPISVSIGDLNGDGKPDLAVANSNDSTVSILINTTVPGDSSSGFSPKKDFTTGSGPYCVSLADLNGDGKLDLIVANNNNYTVSILFNTTNAGDPNPSFSPKNDFTTGLSPRSISVGDLNGDNKPDIAVANNGDQSVSILLNSTNPGDLLPSFSRKTGYPVGNAQRSVSIGDLNGDGKQDLVVVNYFENTVSVLVNDTTTLFSAVLLNHVSLDFGSVRIGQSKDSTVTISNNGTDTLKISAISVNGAAFTNYYGQNTISPGSSMIDTIRFSPLSITTYEAILTITSNASTSPDTVKIRGIGETATSVSQSPEIPGTYSLSQNYPNPFNPTTTITYQLASTGYVSLNVYDILGREIASVVDEVQKAGAHSVTFGGAGFSSGLYIYRLNTGNYIATKKMTLVK